MHVVVNGVFVKIISSILDNNTLFLPKVWTTHLHVVGNQFPMYWCLERWFNIFACWNWFPQLRVAVWNLSLCCFLFYDCSEGGDSGSSSDSEEGERGTRHPEIVKGKEKILRESSAHTPGSSSRRHGNQTEAGKDRTQTVPKYFPGGPTAPNLVHSIPPGWKVVPDQENQSMPSYFNMPAPSQHTTIPGQWQFLPSPYVAGGSCGAQLNPINIEDLSMTRESTVKEESVRRRLRRQNKRNAEDETRKRQSAGMKPYAVQVRPSGFIDSGCRGHLKWQEHIRNLTPRLLDMSITTYENQPEASRKKLREALINKFEFLENEVTDSTLDKMIKTWMRKSRERMKRNFGGTTKAPTNVEVKQWDALQRHWSDPKTQEKSERMSENRKKAVYNPRVGRHGYAGKEAKMVRVFPS